MAKTFAQLTQEIEALKTKAEAVRKQEIAGVVARIKSAIKIYALTAHDLGLGFGDEDRAVPKKGAAPKANKGVASVKKSTAKFRDGNGNVWTGRGPRPRWIKAALAAGQTLESFAVAESAEGEGPEVIIKPRAKPKKAAPVAKFKDTAGHSWSGRGPKPKWLKDAIAGGATLEQLAA